MCEQAKLENLGLGAEDQQQAEDVRYLRLCLQLAEQSAALDEAPVGAVLVKDGKILARGWNTRESQQDALGHAEIMCIRKACEVLGSWRLEGCTLYVSLEPCPLCAGAILQSRISRLVFAASDPKAGAVISKVRLLEGGWTQKVSYSHGLLAQEAGDSLRQFFRQKRLQKKEEKRQRRLEEQVSADCQPFGTSPTGPSTSRRLVGRLYLNQAADSFPKSPALQKAFTSYLGEEGAYQRSHLWQYELRELLAALFGATSPSSVIFQPSQTEALNLVLRSCLPKGALVISTPLEHLAVSRCLEALQEERGLRICSLSLEALELVKETDIEGKELIGGKSELTLDLGAKEGEGHRFLAQREDLLRQEIATYLKEKREAPALLLCTAASNLNGQVLPLRSLGRIARDFDLPFAVDAAQFAGVDKLSMQELGIDFLAVPAHKELLSAPGVAALLCSPQQQARLKPLIFGGGEVEGGRLEAGTPSALAIAALRAALLASWRSCPELFVRPPQLDEVEDGPYEEAKREAPPYGSSRYRQLMRGLKQGLKELEVLGLRYLDFDERHLPILSLRHSEWGLSYFSALLEEADISHRLGLHCATWAHRALYQEEAGKEQGSLRLSFGQHFCEAVVEEFLLRLRAVLSREAE